MYKRLRSRRRSDFPKSALIVALLSGSSVRIGAEWIRSARCKVCKVDSLQCRLINANLLLFTNASSSSMFSLSIFDLGSTSTALIRSDFQNHLY